ncbi:uncharacterized protein F54F2.9 isoform X2 [Anabrus simplex]|uniref:uncharacterized protein F54F2.9 isoform X2 n=1 Tax=Anabrus simplex TaxID=316456 RepID=UPI0035A2A29F
MKLCTSCFLFIGFIIGFGRCWDTEELEIFDLVEEIETNFYSLLGVPEDANATEIKKAYRKLSLQLHPDKNDAPDAEIKFRQLVAVYDVLRDQSKRLLYNNVLQNGLPDWRQAVYYYRRVRKMGLAEMAIILFVIVTVGQYIVAWAAYLEKKYTAQIFLEAKLKKLQKKQKKGKYDGPALPETIVVDIPSPSVLDTLPFQLPRMIWFTIMLCPRSVRLMKDYLAERQRRKEQEALSEEEEEAVEVEPRAPRRRKGKFALPEISDTGDCVAGSTNVVQTKNKSEKKQDDVPIVTGGLWTDEDLIELIRLVKKFPQGTASRWEKIAQAMRRSVAEVTFMAKKVKEDGYRVGSAGESPEESTTAGSVDSNGKTGKVKTRGGKHVDENVGSNWTQMQQEALEASLIKYPKSGTLDRWEKIAKCVPGKTKEECMLRYKQCFEIVKRKRGAGDSASTVNESST